MVYGNPADLNLALTKHFEDVRPTDPCTRQMFRRPLTKMEKQCAELEGKMTDWSPGDLASTFDKPLSWLEELRTRNDYTQLVEEARALSTEKKEALTIPAEDYSQEEVEGLFNKEIGPSLQVIRDIRDDEKGKPSDRLKAANLILDMAPKTPKKKEDHQAPQVVINIPYQQVETIKQAALDVGDPGLIDLLEGAGFEESQPSLELPPLPTGKLLSKSHPPLLAKQPRKRAKNVRKRKK